MPTNIRAFLPALFAVMLLAAAVPFSAPAHASDNDATQALSNFDNAMLTQDFDSKRQAVRALADPAVGNDDDVLPRLVAAVEDRQAADDAIQALRQRTGLTPSRWRGQSHYPNYPWSDDPQAWQDWLNERAHARMTEQKLDNLAAQIH
jgi:hypothetical protein